MKKITFLLFFILLLFQFQCSHTDEKTEFKTTGVSYVNVEKVPIIAATLNGKPCKFIVDSGASISLVDISLLDEYNLHQVQGTPGTIDGLGGTAQIVDLSMTTLEIGGIKFNRLLRAQNLSNVLKKIPVSGVVGIIGSDFFKDYGVIIDYKTNALYLADFHQVVAKPEVRR